MGLDYGQWRSVLANERLPAAVVDLDAFDRNAAKLEELVRPSGKTIRLATKSVRVPALIRRTLERGGPWQGLMCFCSGEAALLAGQGFDDLLVAYPTLQREELAELRELHDRGVQVSLVVDSRVGLDALAQAMAGAATPFRVVVELDVATRWFGGAAHIGVRRSPVRTADDLASMLEHAHRTPGELRVIGVMAYEAQVAGLPDRNPFKRLLSPAFRVVRRVSMRDVRRHRSMVADVFAAAGVELELFNGGGTGSLTWARDEPALTELTAGSGLLCSHLFGYYSNLDLEPAAGFALQVARSSDDGYVTCQGGGYVASGEPGWDRVPVPWLPAGAKLVGAEGTGEVQTPVRLPKGCNVDLGEPLLFRHAKAGELAERFGEYLLVAGGELAERAPTYRGLGATFP